MASEDEINNQLMELSQETAKIDKDIQNHLRKLMTPVWNKRRAIVKQIPNFWGRAFENAPMLAFEGENDLEALGNLKDFHVEYDEKNPDYRKIVATFNKNDLFKNETLTKEYIFDDEGEGEVISKSTVEYHPGKEPKTNKRKHDDDDDDFSMSFLEWFTNDDLMLGRIFSDDIFINALEYYNGDDEDDDDEEGKEYSLGESDEDEEEDEEPKQKKSRN